MTDQNKNIANPPKNIRDQVAFMSFIDDMLKEKKDSSIKPDQLVQIKALLLKELNSKVNEHLIALLTEKDQVELNQLLDKNPSDEELDNFFQTKIPNLIPEMTAVLLEFRSAYLYTPVAKKSGEIADKINLDNDFDVPSPAPISK